MGLARSQPVASLPRSAGRGSTVGDQSRDRCPWWLQPGPTGRRTKAPLFCGPSDVVDVDHRRLCRGVRRPLLGSDRPAERVTNVRGRRGPRFEVTESTRVDEAGSRTALEKPVVLAPSLKKRSPTGNGVATAFVADDEPFLLQVLSTRYVAPVEAPADATSSRICQLLV